MPKAEHGSENLDSKIVAVGNVEQWRATGNLVPALTQLTFCNFGDLQLPYLETIAPEVVLTPVLADGFDCADVALKLDAFGYTGSVRALGRGIPKPHIVEREVRSLCPTLDFALVEIDSLSRLI